MSNQIQPSTSRVDVATSALPSVRKAVKALGAKITEERRTPGAVGYTTITLVG